ncbi:MAG: hypothetical protein VKL59_06225 [Nostocaceae cyanobacterium]|nr:hypothetical protein [Nostocaceae cyanobacterium]
MNKKKKLAIASRLCGVQIVLIAASTSCFGLASVAAAGEGGAASAAAFSLRDGSITGYAVSSGVGKNNAAASATNNGALQTNTASALGSAGSIGVSTVNNGTATLTSIVGDPDPMLGTAQVNSINTPSLTTGTNLQNTPTTGTIPIGSVLDTVPLNNAGGLENSVSPGNISIGSQTEN